MSTFLLLLLACRPTTDDTDEPGTPVPTASTGHTGDTAVVQTGDTGPDTWVFDCTALPQPPFPNQRIQGARGYHGLAFDTLGNLVGSDGNSLVRVSAPGQASLWVPNVGSGQQMEYLPDGDLALATNGPVQRVSPAGSVQVIASNVNAYGLIVGPDGFIYTANQSAVNRIDPATGDRTTYVTGVPVPKVINWSPGLDRFYIGTNSSGGEVWMVETDPVTLEPLGAPTLFAQTSSTWHDALGVDVCGNVYVAEFFDRRLYRFDPNGDGGVLVQYPPNQYGHGLVWGSGIGPWDAMAVYVPQPYDGNRVTEAVIGIPDRRFNGGVYETIH